MLDDMKKWLAHPFAEGSQISAGHLFLLVGLFIVFIALWNVILFHLFDNIRGK